MDLEKERRQQEAILSIRRRFGKNAILKGMDFEEGATARERNRQIGGHKA
jgi:DNA polymerase V